LTLLLCARHRGSFWSIKVSLEWHGKKLTILDLFFSLKKRNSWLSLMFVLVWTLLISCLLTSSFSLSHSIEHWISPSKWDGYWSGMRVIFIFKWELGFNSADIGSSLMLSPL
jgi:hypothetical protein